MICFPHAKKEPREIDAACRYRSAEHGVFLDQQNACTEPRRRDRGKHPRRTAANDDNVNRSFIEGFAYDLHEDSPLSIKRSRKHYSTPITAFQ
jgi:hypothetical protein